MLKSISLFILFYLSLLTSNAQDIIRRKYFTYSDSAFQVNEVMILNTKYYDFDDQFPRPEFLFVFDSIKLFLEMHQTICIEIGNHTDSNGRNDYNLELSSKRAQAVYKYLIEKGVDTSRLSYKGYGETLPLVVEIHADGSDCETCRQQNRRTEIKITSTDGSCPIERNFIDVVPNEKTFKDASLKDQLLYEDMKKNSPK